MKKLLSLILAGMMCLSLAACGEKAAPAPSAPTQEATTPTPAPEAPATDNGLPAKPADFPKGTITLYVGYAAGGGVDNAARLLLKYAQNYLDNPLVVTNVTGASGAVAVTQALANPADGATLISIASGAMLGDITGAVTYDFMNDMDMVSLQDCVPYALVFRSNDSRFSTPEEFMDYVKAHPGELTVSTSGVNNANYFAAMSFFEDNGMDVELIPFNGSADAKSAFLGEHVDIFCETLLETNQMTKDGSAVYVCTFGDEPFVDGVATNKDLGIEMSVTGTFRGYAYKAGTSPEVIEYLSAIFELCEKDPGFIAECANLGLDACINYLNPAEADAFMQDQYDSYTVFCQNLGIAK